MITPTERVLSLLFAIALGDAAMAQSTVRVSLDSSGNEGIGHSRDASISADKRFVAFNSLCSTLVPGDTNSGLDVFVRDRQLGVTERVSVDSGGAQANNHSLGASISADGRFVAFESEATNLISGGAPAGNTYVHDRQTGTTILASGGSGGVLPNDGVHGFFPFSEYYPSISADGNRVAFISNATNIAPGTTSGYENVFVHTISTDTTVLVSRNAAGTAEANLPSTSCAISADGRYVVFKSNAQDILSTIEPGFSYDVFRHDLQTGTTNLVSINAAGTGPANQGSVLPAISGDGRYVAFKSQATDLQDPPPFSGTDQVFVRDMLTGTTSRVSKNSGGTSFVQSSTWPSLSDDGRYVCFESFAGLELWDPGGIDIYVHDRATGVTRWVSRTNGGTRGTGYTVHAEISADGSAVTFEGGSPDLVYGDTNGTDDVYVREWADDTWAFTRMCFPGEYGITGCPCSNPPTSSGRGCQNFGAGPVESGRLTGTGDSAFTTDTLVLTADGLNDTSLAVFWQGKGPSLAAGVLHGAGVRCINQSLKRLYTGSAAGGMVSKPGGGDPSIHLRSAAAGDSIPAGQVRYYFVIYRDTNAAGACGNPQSTINLTNAGSVSWAP